MPRLLIVTGLDQGGEFALEGDVATIGRNPENDIVLKDNASSRIHAQVLRRGDHFYIRDLGSTHGTFVNDVRNNAELLLADNDIIRIGATTIMFRAEQTAPKAAAPFNSSAPLPIAPSGETIAFSIPAEAKRSEEGLSEQRLEMLTRVAEAIQSIIDLSQLLNALTDALFRVLEPDRGAIYLRDEATGALRVRVARPSEEDLQISQTIIDYAVANRMSILVSDVAGDERFSAAKSIIAQSILSAICAPLVCRGKVLGVLYIDTRSPLIRYQNEDLALLNIIAAEAAIAIENALLIQQKLEAERLAAIGVAIAGMAHYVKNVLFGIKGSSSLIEDALKTQRYDIITKIWPVLQRSNAKISSLVQDMLSYSKKREPDWERGNLNALLLEIYENQSSRAEQAGVKLLLDLEDEMSDSMFDHKAIHDTLLNLVGNAIEACDRRPAAQVALRTRSLPQDERLSVVVEDNGPGIPEESQKKIFEPFFSTKGSKGTGLGLAVARKAVEEHGGKLLLESAPGKGAAFTIILPIESSDKSETLSQAAISE